MNALNNPDIPMTWLMLRTTGIIAIVLLTISTVVGIVSPVLRSPRRRFVAISIHGTAAATGTILLLGHIVLAVLDSYVHISPMATVVPGASAWEPLWIGVGTVSFDLLILLMVTTLNRFRAPRTWKTVHLVSYALLPLAWIHALAIGSDAADLPMRVTALVGLAAVAGAFVFRQSRRPVTPLAENPARLPAPTAPATPVKEYA